MNRISRLQEEAAPTNRANASFVPRHAGRVGQRVPRPFLARGRRPTIGNFGDLLGIERGTGDLDPKIIITYSSKDKQVAETVCDALERRGLVCWIFVPRTSRPGQNYQEQIVRTIRAVRVMVLVFALPTPTIPTKSKRARTRQPKQPGRHPGADRGRGPERGLRLRIRETRQWIDLFDDWESSITRLIEQIVSIIEDDPPVHPANAAPGATGGAAGLAGGASAKPRAGPAARRAASTSWPASRWVMIAGVVVIIAASAVAYEFVLAPKPMVGLSVSDGWRQRAHGRACADAARAELQRRRRSRNLNSPIRATPAPDAGAENLRTAPAPRPAAQPSRLRPQRRRSPIRTTPMNTPISACRRRTSYRRMSRPRRRQ